MAAVNFFSHDVILPSDLHPLVRVGSAIPDLWGRLPARPLPYRLLPALRAEGSVEARALADGIESHLRADEVFHAHPEFLRRIEVIEPELLAIWPSLVQAELAAHILIEMILDRWLMLQDPARLASYYASFTADSIAAAARLGSTTEASREALGGVLSFFATSRFLEDYRNPAGLADRFARAWARTSFGAQAQEGAPREAIATWVERRYDSLVPGSEALVEAGRAAAAPLFA